VLFDKQTLQDEILGLLSSRKISSCTKGIGEADRRVIMGKIKLVKTGFYGVAIVPEEALEDGATVETGNTGLVIIVPRGSSPEEYGTVLTEALKVFSEHAKNISSNRSVD